MFLFIFHMYPIQYNKKRSNISCAVGSSEYCHVLI